MAFLIRALALALALLLAPLIARAQTPATRSVNRADTVIVVGQDYDEIIARGFIEIGVYENFPPFSHVEAGELKGIDVDVARLIAAALGVEPRIRALPADENVDADLRNWVWRGPVVSGAVVNVLLHVPYNRDFALRNELVVLTGQYFNERIGMAWRDAAYPDGAPTPPYFRFDKVGVENDSIADFYLSNFMGGALLPNIVRFPTLEAAKAALAEGAFDAAMGPLAQLEWRLGAGLRAGKVPLAGLAVGEWTLGVAVRHTFRQLGYAVDDAIQAAVADGRMAAIFAAHGVTWRAPDW